MKKLVTAIVLMGLAAFPGAAAARNVDGTWAPADGDVIRFEVLRQGKPFGFHQVSFGRDAEGRLTARTEVDLKAGLGPVTFFRYRLDATEVWQDGQLVSLKGEVKDDGNKGSVTARRVGDALAVKGTVYDGAAPAGILPPSHWNPGQANATQLLSTEDGEIIDVSVSERGRETVMVAGEPVEATRYLMDSDIDVDLWYDDAGRWVKLSFTARGQEIEYVLSQSY